MTTLKYRINTGNTYTSLQIGNYFGVPLSDGTFILGIVGHNATGMEYYTFSYAAFRELINNIFTIQPSDMTDVSTGVANALYRPIDYVVSCKWYPYVPSDCKGTGITTINIGNQPVTMTNTVYPLLTNQIPEFIMGASVPDNPQASTYLYLDYEPFREVNLYFQPFGNIPLDTTKIGYQGAISACWQIDYATGVAHLKVNCQSGSSNGQILAEVSDDYGVTIPISTLVTNWKMAAGASVLSYLDSTPVGNLVETAHQGINKGLNWLSNKINEFTGSSMNIPAAVETGNKNLLGAAADLLASAKGQLQTTGSVGSFLAYCNIIPYVYAYFRGQEPHDEARFGAPYHASSSLKNVAGFILCANAKVNYTQKSPLEAEQMAVETALNSGVFLE